MKKFRAMVEDRDSSEYGFTVSGEALTLSVNKSKHNNLMEISFSGSRILTKLPSVETLKDEYGEQDWDTLEKMYRVFTKKYSAEAEKLLNKFEQDLNKIVIEMQDEVGKL